MDLTSAMSGIAANLGETFPNLLITLAILVAGIFAAKIVRKVLSKYLSSSGLLSKVAKDPSQRTDIANSVASLGYYFLLLNVLLLVLERMNIVSVLVPLQNLVAQFMNALPNIVGAGIIFYAGWVIAKLCSGVVEMAAAQLDTLIAKKGFDLNFKTSKFLGALTLGAVFLPLMVAGFQALKIQAISGPAISMITDLMSAVPSILGAGLFLAVGFFIGKFVVFMLSGLLDGMNLNAVPQKIGIEGMLPTGKTFVETVGAIVMFFIMLTATTAAVDKLDIPLVSNAFAQLLHFGGGLVLGGVILMVGGFLANLAYEKINDTEGNETLASISRIAILGLVLAMGLKSMGLAENIVTMAFAFTFGSVALASAIAFGWGGQEAAKTVANRWANQAAQKTSAPRPKDMNI